MSRILLICCMLLVLTGCTKYKDEVPATPLPVTTMVKTGDWMVNTYTESGISMINEIGLAFIKFDPSGSLVVTKEGNTYAGTWSEIKSETAHTLKLNLSTADAKLQKISGNWKVTGVSEYFIDLKDGKTSGSSVMNLMKH